MNITIALAVSILWAPILIAHTPQKIAIRPNKKNNTVTITVQHPVRRKCPSSEHYIKQLTVTKNGTFLQIIPFSCQKEFGWIQEEVPLTCTKGDFIQVTAECNTINKTTNKPYSLTKKIVVS